MPPCRPQSGLRQDASIMTGCAAVGDSFEEMALSDGLTLNRQLI